jgi:pyridoxamine 5'-phosphate oxidase
MVEGAASGLLDPEPEDPLIAAKEWLDAANASGRRNSNAMALATSDAAGRPSVRMVLLKAFSVEDGYAVFYTHYGSRKALEIASTGRAAAVLYWQEAGRQLRFEGAVVRSPHAESDAYFATRAWLSQLNAWSSEQSKPLFAPTDLKSRAEARARDFGVDDAWNAAATRPLPRPDFWGGFRLWLDAVELWVEGVDRFHERLRYTRTLAPAGAHAFAGSAWTRHRLQP